MEKADNYLSGQYKCKTCTIKTQEKLLRITCAFLVFERLWYICAMKSEEKKARKPLLSIEVESDEKALFQKVAKARGLSLSALARTLMLDEARRLGIS